jgi:hypothetical protein
MSDRPLVGGGGVSIAVSRSFTPCAWCGLLSEGGPVCSICGSPVIDIAGWTTVLDVTWPIEPPELLPPPMPDPPVWVATVLPESELVAPTLWIAPMLAPQSFRLGAAWAFQPTERERRLVRVEVLRARGARILAIGVGATGVIYLIDHALR